MFMDRLETAMKGTPHEKMIQWHFGGYFANELICKDCPHYSDSREPYLAVSLQVQNKKSIEESLNAFVEGEMLEGDNAYYCDKCEKKVNTLKRICIKRLPRMLILVLKRFKFDLETMQKIKVNDYCEFPHYLNMEPYTQEGLARRDKEKERQAAGEDPMEVEEPPKLKYPKEYYEYKLRGIVVHSGTSEHGHYYSFIQDREDTSVPEEKRWYEFNDERVREFEIDDIADECFGGEEKWGSMMSMAHPMLNMRSEKSRNAYLLFYERITPYEAPAEEEEDIPEGSST